MHVHATSSPDASIPEKDLALRGIEQNLSGIGFVAHVDFHPDDFCTGGFDRAGYEKAFGEALDASGDSIELMLGVEIGEPLRFRCEALRVLQGFDPDFVTGALHWIGDRFTLDGTGFIGLDPMELVEEYYRQTELMVAECDIDILAHMGVVRKGLADAGLPTQFDETSLWPETMERVLTAMIDRGIALEVNTAGLRRPEKITCPPPVVIELFGSLGGELITVGSDTHRDPWVFYGLDYATELLRGTGFSRAYRFRRREARPYPL
jgi:histidinol-phosphatase (PHP family)